MSGKSFGDLWIESFMKSLAEFKDLPVYFKKAGEEAQEAGKKIVDGVAGMAEAAVAGAKELAFKDLSFGVSPAIKAEFTAVEPELKVGEKTADGWFYIGVSEETGKAFYAAPAVQQMNIGEATAAAKEQNVRVPSRGELRQLFQAQSVIGTVPYKAFKEASMEILGVPAIQVAAKNDSPSWFLSSEDSVRKVAVKNLSTGEEGAVSKDYGRHSVWFVRG